MNRDKLRKQLLQMFMDAKYDRENPAKLADKAISIIYADEDKKRNSLARLIMLVQRNKA